MFAGQSLFGRWMEKHLDTSYIQVSTDFRCEIDEGFFRGIASSSRTALFPSQGVLDHSEYVVKRRVKLLEKLVNLTY